MNNLKFQKGKGKPLNEKNIRQIKRGWNAKKKGKKIKYRENNDTDRWIPVTRSASGDAVKECIGEDGKGMGESEL